MLKALHEHRRYVADIASPAPHIVVVQHADELVVGLSRVESSADRR
jgi:hypothetical protein